MNTQTYIPAQKIVSNIENNYYLESLLEKDQNTITIIIPEHTTYILHDSLCLPDIKLTVIIHEYAFFKLIFDAKTEKKSSVKNNISRDYTFILNGNNGQAHAIIRCLDDSKKFNFITKQIHNANNTTSSINLKSVLNKTAQLFSKGMIEITSKGQQTNADLGYKTILLDKQAKAITIPTLEIKANDVVCTHGSAISQFSEEDFFYLSSKGISKEIALQMLVNSFLTI